MEILRYAMVGAFKRTLRQTPEKSPTRLYHQVLPPAFTHQPRLQNSCTGYARAKVDIVPQRPGTFWQMGLYCDPPFETSVGGNNCTALCTNAGRVLTSSFFLSCTLMFTTVL